MKKKRKRTDNLSEDRFNSSIGSVNIEPPKIYSEEQRASRPKKANMNKTEIRRRQSKKRRLKNSVRKALIAISLFVVLIAVGIVLSLTVFFKIDTVNVTGSGMYSSEEVLANVNFNYGDNLFLIKTDACKAKLTKNLPYVYDVKITKGLPGTVELKITDAKVEYTIQNKDKTFILLDDNFKVLDNASPQGDDAAIKINDSAITQAEKGAVVVFENENVSACLTKMSDAIKNTQMIEATSISSKGDNSNFIAYDNRIVFALGSCDDIENKIYRGLAACEKLNKSAPNVKGTLNLDNDKQIYFTEK